MTLPAFNFKRTIEVKKLATIILSLVAPAIAAFAASNMDEARRLVTEGDYWGARQLLEKEAKANPKVTNTAQYSYLMGVCEFETGEYANARKLLEQAKAKGNGASNLYLGRLAFLDYDFPKATELYGDFRKYREKAKQPAGEDVEELERQLQSAESALNSVEQITVLDSLAVPVDGFYQFYKLPHSAGRLLAPFEMPLEEHRGGAVMAFQNEGGDFMMWGEPDSVGNVKLVESIKLTDGKWHEPTPTPDFLSKGGYADYPFMMPDGVTLYYASDGEDSMGGYDIFVVGRDAQTGEYLQPQNIGMPFNSPHDDFMLAIDEENGVGWWATDRNLLGDKLTIYIYKVNDVRKNYNHDDEEILAKARLSDWKSTRNPEEDEELGELLAHVMAIDPDDVPEEADFHLPKGKGEYYTRYDQLPQAARGVMKRYLKAQASLEKEEQRLQALRKRYSVNHADNVARQIEGFEQDMIEQRKALIQLRSELYKNIRNER